MKPIFKIGEHDYTAFLMEEGLSPVREDLDADGSGRNLLDGLMYRNRITDKDKWTTKWMNLPETIMLSLANDIKPEYVSITMLDPDTNRYVTKTYYCSKLTYGAQVYDPGKGYTVYRGCTFNITER